MRHYSCPSSKQRQARGLLCHAIFMILDIVGADSSCVSIIKHRCTLTSCLAPSSSADKGSITLDWVWAWWSMMPAYRWYEDVKECTAVDIHTLEPGVQPPWVRARVSGSESFCVSPPYQCVHQYVRMGVCVCVLESIWEYMAMWICCVIYSGENKYLNPCRFRKFGHLQRNVWSIIVMVGVF